MRGGSAPSTCQDGWCLELAQTVCAFCPCHSSAAQRGHLRLQGSLEKVCLQAPHQERRVCEVVGSSGRDKTQNRTSDPADAMWGYAGPPLVECVLSAYG